MTASASASAPSWTRSTGSLSGDPFFYENRHTSPQPVPGGKQPGGEEFWIYYNTHRFSGKKLVVKPGGKYTGTDKGVYNILVWHGSGRFDGHDIKAGDFHKDELLVSHSAPSSRSRWRIPGARTFWSSSFSDRISITDVSR